MLPLSRQILATLAACFAGLAAGPLPAQQSFVNGVEISDSDPAVADLYVEDYSVLDGQVCIGNGCASNVLPALNAELMIKSSTPTINFEDTSTNPGFPARNWQLRINDPGSGGIERFAIKDRTANTIPFSILGGAPDNVMTIDAQGEVGIGTLLPIANLHVQSSTFPEIRLEQDGAGGHTPYAWSSYIGHDGSLLFFDKTNGERRLVLHPAEGDIPGSVELESDGDVFITDQGGNPAVSGQARLHVKYEDGTAQVKIEENIDTQAARPLLHLTNYGRPDIIMANTATGGEWAFGAGTNFVLKTGTIGSSDGDKTLHFKLFGATGDLEITGQIITGGGTCGGGCDAVFSEGYDLPSIEDHAAEMFALGHLPNVGPTAPNQPINVSDKLGRMLNELEHAHIYIARQQAEITALKADHAARLAALEAKLRALRARE